LGARPAHAGPHTGSASRSGLLTRYAPAQHKAVFLATRCAGPRETGASSGIGAAFGGHLARDGYDLVLVARRRDRLAELATRLAEDGRCEVDVLAADLAAPGGLGSVEDHIAALPRLDLLVNNAGFAGYAPFTALDPAIATALIGVHVTTPTQLTRTALPQMTERGREALINIASLLAFSGQPSARPLPFRAT
jgi:short-subunit dehydrogenase